MRRHAQGSPNRKPVAVEFDDRSTGWREDVDRGPRKMSENCAGFNAELHLRCHSKRMQADRRNGLASLVGHEGDGIRPRTSFFAPGKGDRGKEQISSQHWDLL